MLSRILYKSPLNVRNYSTFVETKRVAEITTLENGLKVVSLSGGFTGPATALGIYINAGSRFENQSNAGSSQVLKNLVFQSNTNKINLEVQREIELMGSTAFAQVGRDNLLVGTEALPMNAKRMLVSLANITKPTLPYHEVRDCTEQTLEESESLQHDVVTQLFESLHKQAYRGRTLGRPLVAPTCNLSDLSTDTVTAFADSAYTPSNMVLVGVGLAHADLVAQAQLVSFGRSKNQANITKESAKYVGGDDLVYASGNTHIVVAFEGASSKNAKDNAAAAVLHTILGGGSVVPKTAPGNGKTSRLHALLDKKQGSLAKTDTFNINYADTGLFGVYAESNNTVATSQIIADLVKEIAAAGKVSGQELERAKALTKTHVIDSADTRTGALEFIGKQALYDAKLLTPEEYAAQIQSITADDVKRVAQKILSSKPTIVVRGDISDVPTVDQVISFSKN